MLKKKQTIFPNRWDDSTVVIIDLDSNLNRFF